MLHEVQFVMLLLQVRQIELQPVHTPESGARLPPGGHESAHEPL
jgi:hypothetical protein